MARVHARSKNSEPARSKRKLSVHDSGPEGNANSQPLSSEADSERDDAEALDSDALDDDEASTRKIKRFPNKKPSPRKAPPRKRKRKADSEDGDPSALEDGQEVVGTIVRASTSGRGVLR